MSKARTRSNKSTGAPRNVSITYKQLRLPRIPHLTTNTTTMEGSPRNELHAPSSDTTNATFARIENRAFSYLPIFAGLAQAFLGTFCYFIKASLDLFLVFRPTLMQEGQHKIEWYAQGIIKGKYRAVNHFRNLHGLASP